MESTHRQLKITVSCSLTWQTDPENMASKMLILPDWAPTKIMHYGLHNMLGHILMIHAPIYAQVSSLYFLSTLYVTHGINYSRAEPGNGATDTFSATHTDNISYMCVHTNIAHENTCVQKTRITNLYSGSLYSDRKSPRKTS